MQIKRDKARRILEEQSATGALEVGPTRMISRCQLITLQLDAERECTLLTAQKEALEREIAYIDLEAANYIERHANFEERKQAIDGENATEDDIMIDPALEPFAQESVAGSLSDPSNESVYVGSSSDGYVSLISWVP